MEEKKHLSLVQTIQVYKLSLFNTMNNNTQKKLYFCSLRKKQSSSIFCMHAYKSITSSHSQPSRVQNSVLYMSVAIYCRYMWLNTVTCSTTDPVKVKIKHICVGQYVRTSSHFRSGSSVRMLYFKTMRQSQIHQINLMLI